ncbi:substrate-binding periplasmic protein [Paramagnetospirillum kuznetsovii]|nr:transporter substrate-binding domain-containing protein [Paramagnetospirillum kuznetsovii]
MRSAIFFLGLAVAIFRPGLALAEPLTIGFIERPGYSWQGERQAEGLFIDIARDILTRAGIEHQFQAMPPKRMLKSVQEGKDRICIVGNFKTPEREAYAVFTKSIYQNKPIGVLISADRSEAFAPFKTLAALAEAPDLRLGYVDGFSYGTAVDAVIAKMKTVELSRGNTTTGMVSMLAAGRFDYMFADQEEYVDLAKGANIPPASLRLLTFPDVPVGNKRYMMCSKTVPKAVIERIDAAILP